MNKSLNYVTFDEESLNEFCNILDYENNGIICLLDLENVCKKMEMDDIYQYIKSLFQPFCQKDKLGISKEDIKSLLISENKTMETEIEDIFNSWDYDKKTYINKNKLRINFNKIMGFDTTDEELEDMIKYIGTGDKILLSDLKKLIS